MSQDIVSDTLNEIMNAKRVERREIYIKRSSKLLFNLMDIMKKEGHIDYEKKGGGVLIKIIRVNECKSVKPRFNVRVENIEKYLKRYLPSRKFGKLIISTNKGLLDQFQAEESGIGGSLIAYFY